MRRLRIITFTLLVILSYCMAIAQCVQNGVVLEYRGEKNKVALANVEIVVNNAGSTVTDRNGHFTLQFRTLKPGDKVTIKRINKPGYEVFNTDILDQWFISRDGTEVTIVMCRSARLNELKRKYELIANSRYTTQLENSRQEINSSLNSGTITKAQYDKKLKELEDQYNKQLDNIDNYIDHFARIDLTELSRKEREIIKDVNDGNLDDAIKKYDEADLLSKYKQLSSDYKSLSDAEKKIQEEKAKHKADRENLQKAIDRQVYLLRIAGGKDNVDKALQLLHDASYCDTTEVSAMLDYAYYIRKTERVNESVEAYQIAERNSSDGSIDKAMANIGLSNCYTKTRDWNEVKDKSLEAVKIIKALREESGNENLYIKEFVEANIGLATSYSSLVDTANIEKSFDEVLTSANKLYEMQPNELRTLTDAEVLAGSAYRKIGDLKKAKECLISATENAKKIYEQNKTLGVGIYGYCESGLASYYNSIHDIAAFTEHYKRADSIYTEAIKINPDAYTRYYTQNLINFANAMINVRIFGGDSLLYKQALPYITKAIEMYHQIGIERGMDQMTMEESVCWINLGHYYYYERDFEKAESYAQKGLDGLMPYYTKYPKTHKSFYLVAKEVIRLSKAKIPDEMAE